MPSMTEPPPASARAKFRQDFGQRFLLTVDAEEDFDWSAPFDRTAHNLHHVPRLSKFQEFCRGMEVVPVYLVDYPIATSRLAIDILCEPLARKEAEIGIQLHPWVNPPHLEDVNNFNSFAGNLDEELERAKLLKLRDTIAANFGVEPVIYRAGRYGIGPHTEAILRDAGVGIDTSVRARFDYSASGGVNFRDHPLHPYWIGEGRSLLELPLTTAFWGLLRPFGHALYPAMWRAPRLRGILARIGLLDRIPLTPEGVSVTEALRGIDAALDEQLPLLVFSFHSPSLRPGSTPYVRNEDDLDRLYDWWRTVISHMRARGVQPTTIAEIMSAVDF